jgi:hypothetical protein
MSVTTRVQIVTVLCAWVIWSEYRGPGSLFVPHGPGPTFTPQSEYASLAECKAKVEVLNDREWKSQRDAAVEGRKLTDNVYYRCWPAGIAPSGERR